jgi:hypothetical protein
MPIDRRPNYVVISATLVGWVFGLLLNSGFLAICGVLHRDKWLGRSVTNHLDVSEVSAILCLTVVPFLFGVAGSVLGRRYKW